VSGEQPPRCDAARLFLLGGFELTVGHRPVSLPAGLKRLLALLAVRGHRVTRSYIGGMLWGGASEERAQGSLRSDLSRLRSLGLSLVEKQGDTLDLAPHVEVDLYEANRTARSVIDADGCRTESADGTLLIDPRMTSELLPGWYDEWVLAERERHRQLTLHALELLCTRLTGDQHYADAVLAGLAAVTQEPLRESSHRALMKAHLAADNPGEALRCFERYRDLAADALGVDPSASMRALVAGVGSVR
jgi:DNA-binding SARP family transcriptional activator